jgi:asparagine synthase (glutamine-hydrolysing)
MCGFCCIVTTDDPPPDAVVDHVAAALAHRGPDDQGVIRHVVDDALHPRHVALVHRRLAILDHEGGRQPMTTTDGRLTVVFNGCIYNHRALRAELEQHGKHFTSDHSDTEVLLLGYEQWGSDLPARLEGMFAFVILDRAASTLFAARDRAGEKPCLIRRTGEHMVIASERAAVRAAADRASVSDADGSAAVVSYLRWGGVDFRTWLDGTAMLPPGRSITMALAPRLEDPAPTSYWSPPRRTISAQEEVDPDQFENLLRDSIERMLEADVPLGCFLSGGVDSSLVAALARSRVPDLATFCVRMPDPRYDESAYASRVAAHLGTEHTTLDAAIHPAADLVELIETVGEPFGDSSLLPTHWVSRAAREHVTVALAGDGGDELFAGYERHLAMGLLANWAPLLRLLPRGSFARAHPKSRRRRLGRLADAARGRGPADHYRSIVHLFDDVQLRGLGLDPGDGCDGPYPDDDLAALVGDRAGIDAALHLDFTANLPIDLLRKVDIASMAVGLEVRCPFLDRALVEAALAAPPAHLLLRRQRKGLLRAIAERHVPAAVLNRPKMGFAIPIGTWFRDDFGGLGTLLRDHLGSSDPFPGLPIEPKGARRLMDDHLAGRADHDQRLFALLTLSIWARDAQGYRQFVSSILG